MLELSNQILWCVVFMCMLLELTADDENLCSCQCSDPYKGRVEICTKLQNEMLPKVDNSQNEIDSLKQEIVDLKSKQDKTEKIVNVLERDEIRKLERRIGSVETRYSSFGDALDKLDENIEDLHRTFVAVNLNLGPQLNILLEKSQEFEKILETFPLSVISEKISEISTSIQSFSSFEGTILDHDTSIQKLQKTFEDFEKELGPAVQDLKEKSQQFEKILENMPASGTSADITKIVSDIQNTKDTQQMNLLISAVKELQCPNYVPKLDLRSIFDDLDGHEKCGDVQLPNNLGSISGSGVTQDSNEKLKGTVNKLFLKVRGKFSNEAEYRDLGVAIVLTDHWAVFTIPSDIRRFWQIRFEVLDSRDRFIPVQLVSIVSTYTNDRLLYSENAFNSNDVQQKFVATCLPKSRERDKLFGPATYVAIDSQGIKSLSDICILPNNECQRRYNVTLTVDLCAEYNHQARESCEAANSYGFLLKEIQGKVLLIGLQRGTCGRENEPMMFQPITHFIDRINYSIKTFVA